MVIGIVTYAAGWSTERYAPRTMPIFSLFTESSSRQVSVPQIPILVVKNGFDLSVWHNVFIWCDEHELVAVYYSSTG